MPKLKNNSDKLSVIDQQALNIIFAGTPVFAARCLTALLASPHHIKAVLTQPDRPAGRGQKISESPVKQLALQQHIPIHQPLTLRDPAIQAILQSYQADLCVVVAYGLILPSAVLTLPTLGCVNVHASLLPRWRGAAPIQRAILAGDQTSGITIMQMDQGLDTGAMLYQATCPIQPTDTSEILHDRLAVLGAEGLLTVLNDFAKFSKKAETQEEASATYAHKIKKEEAKLNWHLSADQLAETVRAFNPWPVAFAHLDDQLIRVWEAVPLNSYEKSSSVGKIIAASAEGIDVATELGVLRLLTLQLAGGRALPVADILNSRRQLFAIGASFS